VGGAVLRLVTAGDIPVVTAFRRLMFEELDDFEPARLDAMAGAFVAYAERAIPSGEYVGWLAEDEGVPVATSGLVFQAIPPHPLNLTGRSGYVLNVYVTPEWRRQGLATCLVAQAIEHCRSLGLSAVLLHASDTGAAVYRKLGFESTSEMRIYL
jgi:GNAT superfamily N-acetyltransferase